MSHRVFACANLGALIALLLASWFVGGCKTPVELASGSTMPMKCHWTFISVTFVSLIAIVLVVVSLIKRDKELKAIIENESKKC